MTIDHGLAAALAGSTDAAVARSPEWEHVRKAHLQREPRCVCCGDAWVDGTPVQVHHIFPFHYCIALGRPDLELDPRNLVTLCESGQGRTGENHHLLVGHLDNFEAANPDSRTDSAGRYQGRSGLQIRADTQWRAEVLTRVPPLRKMAPGEREAYRRLMDKTFPQAPRRAAER